MQITITINDFENRWMPQPADPVDLARDVYDDIAGSYDLDPDQISITIDGAEVNYDKLFGWVTASYPQPEEATLYCDEAGDVRTKYVS